MTNWDTAPAIDPKQIEYKKALLASGLSLPL